MGVGNDPNNINDWVKDIFDSFDRDGNGQIDKHEIKSFID
jgi:Ca2+-binding EF-hand superfamily protein